MDSVAQLSFNSIASHEPLDITYHLRKDEWFNYIIKIKT